jgi:hypothetical protein
MRNLILKMSMSLEGFIGGQNSWNEWVFKTGDGKHWPGIGELRKQEELEQQSKEIYNSEF